MEMKSILYTNRRIQLGGMPYSRTSKGWFKIGGTKSFYKSSWEVNYARYLQWLLERKEILKWEYEPQTFWFEKIKRGVRSYTPDFKITNNNKSIEFHEVKGWMDGRSITKLKRMKKYYPQIDMKLIEKDGYKSILQYEKMFPDAEAIIKSTYRD